MLPEPVRLRRSADFGDVVRRGRRAGRPTLVVHLLDAEAPVTGSQPLVGFIVSKQVGDSVHRHRVTRQLRHLMRDRFSELPAGARVVVRARPDAADRTSTDLGRDLDASLRRLVGAAR